MLTQPPSSVQRTRSTAFRVVLSICILFSPLMVGLAFFIRSGSANSWDYQERWRGVWASAILLGLVYGLIFWLFRPFTFLLVGIWAGLQLHQFTATLGWLAVLWVYNALLSPALAVIYEALVPQTPRIVTSPRQSLPSPQQMRAEEGLRSQGFRQVSNDVLVGFPEKVGEHGVIGRPLGGDLWEWLQEGFFFYPLYVLIYHAVIIGRSGSGKSELLRRIAYLAAKIYGMKVVNFDGKGEWEDAARFQLTMEKAGCKKIGIFPLTAHNGWRGSRQDVLNLLMSSQLFESDYYRGVTLNILKFALYAPGLPPVADGQELLRRIYPPALQEMYKGMEESDYLDSLSKDALWGPYGRYQAFFGAVLDRLDGETGYGDWDAAYYLLDKKRLQREIGAFARYLIEDFQLYMALRQVHRKDQRILLILDDYSAYSDMVGVFDLFERVRSAGGCVIACAQGYQGLGPDAERLLEGAATIILNRCSLPEKFIRMAGVRKTPEISFHMHTNSDDVDAKPEEVDSATMHMVDEPGVHPDEVRKLAKGESVFLYGNEWQKIAVQRVELDKVQVEVLTKELIQGYEAAQETYEQTRVEALTNRSAAISKSEKSPADERKGSKKRKEKIPAPEPPQPGQQVAASVIIHAPGVVIHSAGVQSQQSTEKVSAQPVASSTINEPPVSVETKRTDVVKEGSSPAPQQSKPKPRSLDEVE